MAFSYLNNVPLNQARSEYLARLREQGFGPETETVPVSVAHGRITAQAVYASRNVPHYAAAAMDGVAVAAADTFGAAENAALTLQVGQFVPVDTGDPLPEGCDAVIMAEDLIPNPDGSLGIRVPATPWQHIRQIGEDICAGEMILGSHLPITPAAVGALIAGGVLELPVLKRPVVGLIPTGDEIVPPDAQPEPGQILEFNSAIFSAMLKDWGAEPSTYPITPDRPELLQAVLRQALDECDVVIVNAGSSAGRDDGTATAIAAVGQVFLHGIAIRPGKPAILGFAGKRPILGVPGYPVSGILVLEEIVRPLLHQWFAQESSDPPKARAVLARPIVSGLKYEEFVRTRLGFVGGQLVASPLARGAGVVSSFMKADGILTVPQGVEGYPAGAEVEVRLLSTEQRLRHTLVVIGSHDPLLDELADLLHRADSSLFMSSTHVGSMGGIMAIRRGEAHVAGCHLLDTESGEYNKSFLRKYFPQGGVRLLRCVGRQQGLMLAAGNPLGIRAVDDLARPGLRYVNRQKGAGTRILLDWLCARHGVDTTALSGYTREELTHNAVAVQIAGGTADAGLGILSAARLYGLDFLPLCVEEYDLLVAESQWESGAVQALVTMLKSAAFRDRILALGGYTVEGAGEEIDWHS